MSDVSKKSKEDWPAFLFLFMVLPVTFTYGGIWVGIAVLIIGTVALGWSKRNQGPFPTNKPKE